MANIQYHVLEVFSMQSTDPKNLETNPEPTPQVNTQHGTMVSMSTQELCLRWMLSWRNIV